MPKKTQQKRRHSKKQKRTLKRNVKRTMRGGAIVHYRQISPMGSSPIYSENVNSVSNWISLWGDNYRGFDIEDGLTIHKIWQNMG
jgi:hypothetical protein